MISRKGALFAATLALLLQVLAFLEFGLRRPGVTFFMYLVMFFSAPYLLSFVLTEALPQIGVVVIPSKARALRVGLAIAIAVVQLIGLSMAVVFSTWTRLMPYHGTGVLALMALAAATGILIGERVFASRAYRY